MERAQSIGVADVTAEIAGGYVRAQRSPFDPRLCILNYTKKTQFEQRWNNITKKCRGLVVDISTDKTTYPIVISCPEKFFNQGEPQAPNIDNWTKEQLYFSEKLDGYYISIRNDSQFGLIVTSRGSFDNQYVEAAKKLLPPDIPKDIDFFCELCQDFIGDESLIVTRHPTPKLVLWGVNDSVPVLRMGWKGEVAKTLSKDEIEQFMKQETEGVVAFNLETKQRIKIKTEWYFKMHRAISHCTLNDALSILHGGGSFLNSEETDYTAQDGETHVLHLSTLPEEHLARLRQWEKQFRDMRDIVIGMVENDYMDAPLTAKEYALTTKSPKDIQNIVFAMMNHKDDKTVEERIWQATERRLRSLLGDSDNQ